ncbi:MAG: membrane protein insertase YidC [Clostridiales bacterium]|nr:membrane protein insertase YidC [Clostridiales bacterium]
MDLINTILGIPLGYIMYACYYLTSNYGLSIILFTLVSKLILLPISIQVQKNSIKMVKLQPELTAIRERYAGDKDRIAEEQIKLYDQEHYSPAVGCLPMLLQIPLVLGLISVIYHPLQHLLHLDAASINALVAQAQTLLGTAELGASPQMAVIRLLGDPAMAEGFSGFAPELIAAVKSLQLHFLGLNLSLLPSLGSILMLIPLLAGLSAWLLCFVQDRANVLQREQSKSSQLGMTLFMVAFSTYFAFIVPAGVGLYWIFGNLFAILQLFLLNLLYDPARFIDYSSRPAPLTREQLAAKKQEEAYAAQKEKQDRKRFFDLNNWDKQLIVYSEGSGFYKYFRDILDWLLRNTRIPIHYVTSDPRDQIFDLARQREDQRIIPYYVSPKKLAGFFLKADADMMLMTMPDLGQFHLKRSLARKDMEYVYCFHYPLSTHMVLRRRALSDYDTVLLVGEFQREEIRQAEKLDGTREKNLITCGYGLLEQLARRYEAMEKAEHTRKKLLIAPSWQPDNILDLCIHPLLEALLGKGYDVVLRPHPEYVKRYKARMDAIVQRYTTQSHPDLSFELDFSVDNSLYDSDLVITDWSGTAYEFAFITKKPVLFINTPPKINNPDYELLTVKPLEISLRSQIGQSLEPDDLSLATETVAYLLEHSEEYREKIETIFTQTIANFGHSGQASGQYIASAIAKKRQGRG